jgi:hypothetical protein
MSVRLLLAALFLLPMAGCPAQQPATKSTLEAGPSIPMPYRLTRKEKLAKLLAAKDVPTEKQLRVLGDGIDSDLVDIINNRRVNQTMRLRALYCIGYFQNRRAHLLLRTVLTDPNWDKPYRIAALRAISRSVGSDSYSTIKEYSLDPDDDMRLAAVEALTSIGSQEALNLLKTLQLREKNPAVMDAIDYGIRTIGRSPLEGY